MNIPMPLEPELVDIDLADRYRRHESFGVSEYLGLWGADPCYDTPPRNRGDGYVFYNYNSKKNDVFYLKTQLLPAINRQLQDQNLTGLERRNFQKIVEHVQRRISSLS